MTNLALRQCAARNHVYLYQLAYALGYSDSHFCKMLRNELSPELTEKAFAAIERIAEEERDNDNAEIYVH